MSNSDPPSPSDVTVIHHAKRGAGPTACGVSEMPRPSTTQWPLVTCPACLAVAPAGEQDKPRAAKSTIVGRPLVMNHKPGCAALADPPAACNCH